MWFNCSYHNLNICYYGRPMVNFYRIQTVGIMQFHGKGKEVLQLYFTHPCAHTRQWVVNTHTHTHTHTHRECTPGAVLRVWTHTQLWFWGWKRALVVYSPHLQSLLVLRLETHNLFATSLTLTIRPMVVTVFTDATVLNINVHMRPYCTPNSSYYYCQLKELSNVHF